MQHRKYVKQIKKGGGGMIDKTSKYSLFIVINAHKKHSYVFFIHDPMNITIKPANIKIKNKNTHIHTHELQIPHKK
jgi:hypothetical protein